MKQLRTSKNYLLKMQKSILVFPSLKRWNRCSLMFRKMIGKGSPAQRCFSCEIHPFATVDQASNSHDSWSFGPWIRKTVHQPVLWSVDPRRFNEIDEDLWWNWWKMCDEVLWILRELEGKVVMILGEWNVIMILLWLATYTHSLIHFLNPN